MKRSELEALGFVSFVVCIALLVWVMSLDGPSPRGANANESDQQQAAPNARQSNPGQLGTEGTPLVIAMVDGAPAQFGSKQTKYWTNEKPSDWWMIGITAFLAVIAGGQAWLFVKQLTLMKDALKHAADNAQGAMDAAKATKQAVDTARHSSEQGLRAYVGIVLHPKRHVDHPAHVWRIHFENCGQTPAHSLRGRMDWLWFEGADADWPADKSFINSDTGGSVSTVLPHIEAYSEAIMEDLPDGSKYSVAMGRMKRGEVTIYYFGSLDYEDIFGRAHFTHFCVKTRQRGSIIWQKHNDSD